MLKPRWIPALFALALTLGLTACGDDDNGGTGPGNSPPTAVVTPNIPATANFQSSDPKAQSAQAQVSVQLALASSQSSVAAGYLAPFQQGNWGNQSGGCWTYAASGGQGCTFRYEVCEISSGYEWLWTYDGS